MDFKQSIDFLYQQLPMFSRTGAAAYKPGLDTVRKLDTFFSHPHQRYATIHIAGTNGKGSTSHLIAAVLQAQGYKVGLYTSPHLVDFRERIRVNGAMIPRGAVADFVTRYLESNYDGQPSFFELTMMMAFDWFAHSKVDIAVIEVGMGGLLDSTNIITPQLSVITNISEDHKQFLGETIAEIAIQKAGIIKPEIPVVIGERQSETTSVFKETAQQQNAPIVWASDNPLGFKITENQSRNGWHISLPLIGLKADCPLEGYYQQKNILTALYALARLEAFPTSPEAMAYGFSHVTRLTGLAGRWMVTGHEPLTVCDTGHNHAGIESNMTQLRDWILRHPGSNLHIVIGFVADKDIEGILPLLPPDANYYFTQANIPRALDARILAQMAEQHGLNGRSYPSVKDAIHDALSVTQPQDLVFIGGSTFVIADYLAIQQLGQPHQNLALSSKPVR